MPASAAPADNNAAVAEAPRRPALRVLLVEDHPDLARHVGRFLAAAGHTVDFAGTGPQGLALATQNAYDVIVLDRMLPGFDGAMLCQRLRTEARSSVPVLMLTALAATDDKLSGFRAGADDYLPKPFDLAELEARLQALHRRAQGAVAQQLLTVGDLVYDPHTLTARRGGQVLTLTPVTRKLLEYLMRHSHRVVPRSELEHVLWGAQVPAGDVLRAHVHNLRSAIDRPFPRKLLHTVPGAGYRLSAV